MTLKSDSLAFALLGAANALAAVESGVALPRALALEFDSADMTPGARGAIQDLAYRSMRAWGSSQTLLALLTEKAPQQVRLKTLVCCALALLADTDPAYAPHTVVDQAVVAANSDAELVRAKGMVNAVLRRFLRERESLLAQAVMQETARWNYPQWWIDKARTSWPDKWQSLLAAGNAQAPLTLRVNQRKTTVSDYLAILAQHGMAATQIGTHAVRLTQALPVSRIPFFSEGWVSVQDSAAQLAAPLLDVKDGMRVLDACAAPGGKTGHLLELARPELFALDHDGQRLERVAQNLTRLQLDARLVVGDASLQSWWDGILFDRILADVPCTASGIVRRHPDIRWLRRPADSRQLAKQSSAILDNLWQLLKPSGKLLLVTCSLWPEESVQQADAFAARHQAIRLDAPGQLLPVATADHDQDGLFYALFQKASV
jgi:16S rRNA (cytosine967-C5)-methyltransferase